MRLEANRRRRRGRALALGSVLLEQPRDERHPHRDAGGGLLEVHRARVAIEFVSEFVGARQRMHHDRLVRAAGLERPHIEVAVLTAVAFLVIHPLALQPRQVERVERDRRRRRRQCALQRHVGGEQRHLMRRVGRQVERVDSARERAQLFHRDRRKTVLAFGGDAFQHVVRHVHPVIRHGHDVGAEAGERINQRMDGAAEFQIAADGDRQSPQLPLLAAQDIEVAKRLCRMLAAAVARVNHGAWRVLGGDPRRAVARMAHHDNVGIGAHHAHGVGQGFALGGRGRVHVGRADDGAAEPMHRGFETQARAGRRFVEKRRHDKAVGSLERFAAFEPGGERVGELENPLDIDRGQVFDRDDVVFSEPRHRAQAAAPRLAPPITTSSTPSTLGQAHVHSLVARRLDMRPT